MSTWEDRDFPCSARSDRIPVDAKEGLPDKRATALFSRYVKLEKKSQQIWEPRLGRRFASPSETSSLLSPSSSPFLLDLIPTSILTLTPPTLTLLPFLTHLSLSRSTLSFSSPFSRAHIESKIKSRLILYVGMSVAKSVDGCGWAGESRAAEADEVKVRKGERRKEIKPGEETKRKRGRARERKMNVKCLFLGGGS